MGVATVDSSRVELPAGKLTSSGRGERIFYLFPGDSCLPLLSSEKQEQDECDG